MAESRRRGKEESERYMANFRAKYPNEGLSDLLAFQAREYREHWEGVWSSLFGSFETTTPIPPMRFTDHQPVPSHAGVQDTLQIFSVRIKETNQSLQWPLQVFGIIAARDPIDRNRNIIFNCERDNCQILTQEDPFLKLTGPTRAVVVCDPVYFEVALKVKGSVESEDKDLSLLAVPLTDYSDIISTCLVNKVYTSKLILTLFGYVVESVEATISVHITEGSWPDDFFCDFTAQTSSLENETVRLLGCEKIHVDDDGTIKLSRFVASVEFEGELKVSVAAFRYDEDLGKVIMIGKDDMGFRPNKAGKSYGRLDVGFCKMDITVAWSLISLISALFA
ncbi:unnamed protein product [Urochloa humidicola]